MSSNPNTGEVQWSPTLADVGDYTVDASFSDGRGGSVETQFLRSILETPPNGPPFFTTTPLTETIGSPVPEPRAINLTGWTVAQYEYGPLQPAENWEIQPDETSVLQSVASDASILLSDSVANNERIRGTFRSDADDDFIGFVFGYQDSEHYYLFDWTGEFEITVSDGATTLVTIAIQDETCPSGEFGFYNSSQESDYYSDFTRESLPEITYVYGADSRDPDDDPLNYTLSKGSDGMHIDSATGVITWAPTTDQIGDHSATIEADDNRGGVAQQTFVLHVSAAVGAELLAIPIEFGMPVTVDEPSAGTLDAVTADLAYPATRPMSQVNRTSRPQAKTRDDSASADIEAHCRTRAHAHERATEISQC